MSRNRQRAINLRQTQTEAEMLVWCEPLGLQTATRIKSVALSAKLQ